MTMQTCEPKSVDLYFWKTVAQAWCPALPAEPKGCEPTAPVGKVVETKTPEPKIPAQANPSRPARTISVLDKVARGFVTVTGSLCTQAVELDDDDDEELLADLGLS